MLYLSWAFALISIVAAYQPDYILRVSSETIAPACQPRNSVVINGTFPGPLLRFTEGGHYWVRVYNDLADQNTTVHFHGFTQFASPFSDGTPQGSQWPIPPGRYFDYEFQLEDGFYGTYWYHSHVGMQSISAKGPIVVDPKTKTSPVHYDEEIVMMMSDYYNSEDHKMEVGLLNNTKFAWVGEANALAVNGHAFGVCNATMLKPDQNCNTSCGNSVQLVKPGRKYRVRIIGASVLSHISMALEGHKMTLFEADGTFLRPKKIDNLEIAPGQRYSVLIETDRKPKKRDFYWRMKTIWRPLSIEGSALWRYDSSARSPDAYNYAPQLSNYSVSASPAPADIKTLVPLPNATFGWVSDELREWRQEDKTPLRVTRTIFLDGQQVRNEGGLRWAVSKHVTYETSPSIPYLVDFYGKDDSLRNPNYTAALANGGLDVATESYPAKLGEVLDIVLQNQGGPTGVVESHPWHLHGSKYWDMGGGVGNFSYAALNASLKSRGGKPFRRDTSIVYAGPGASYKNETIATGAPGGWRLFRIQVTNPGLWVMHCHIIPHQVMGMLVNFMFAAEDLPPLPEGYYSDYSTFGGAAYSAQNATFTPKSYFAESSR